MCHNGGRDGFSEPPSVVLKICSCGRSVNGRPPCSEKRLALERLRLTHLAPDVLVQKAQEIPPAFPTAGAFS